MHNRKCWSKKGSLAWLGLGLLVLSPLTLKSKSWVLKIGTEQYIDQSIDRLMSKISTLTKNTSGHQAFLSKKVVTIRRVSWIIFTYKIFFIMVAPTNERRGGRESGWGRGVNTWAKVGHYSLIKTSNFYVVIVLVHIRHRIAENSYYRLPIVS